MVVSVPIQPDMADDPRTCSGVTFKHFLLRTYPLILSVWREVRRVHVDIRGRMWLHAKMGGVAPGSEGPEGWGLAGRGGGSGKDNGCRIWTDNGCHSR